MGLAHQPQESCLQSHLSAHDVRHRRPAEQATLPTQNVCRMPGCPRDSGSRGNSAGRWSVDCRGSRIALTWGVEIVSAAPVAPFYLPPSSICDAIPSGRARSGAAYARSGSRGPDVSPSRITTSAAVVCPWHLQRGSPLQARSGHRPPQEVAAKFSGSDFPS